MAKSKSSGPSVVFYCLSLLWVNIGAELVNYLGPEGAAYNVLYSELAGVVLWALAEAFVPDAAGKFRRFLLLAAVPFTFLLHFYEWPVYTAVTVIFGLLLGAVLSATFAGISARFDGKYRYTKISASIGCFFCGVSVYLLLTEPLFNSLYESGLAAGMGDEEAFMLTIGRGGLIIHAVMAAIPLVLCALYRTPKPMDADNEMPAVFVGLPTNRWLLAAIGLGVVLLSCVMSTQFKAYLTVSDNQDIDLMTMFITARIARLPMVALYGFLLDKKRWRLMVAIPLVMIMLCGSIPLLFSGTAEAGFVYFLAVMGGHSFTYLLLVLPVMLASRIKRPALFSCLGPALYMLITVFLDVNIARFEVGPTLYEHKEVLFVAVVLCAVPMFFLLMEFFIRQRGIELQAEFAASLARTPAPSAGDIPATPLPPAPGVPDIVGIARTYMLTRRETELLPYLLSPLTAEDISKETYVSVSTIRTHISNILGKMQVTSRRDLQKSFGQISEA